jgi:imidazolonepropionase-like amidohydrolase
MTMLVKADWLFDGTGTPPIADPVLAIGDDGQIMAVFQGQVPDGAVPADTPVLDCGGCTLMPGMIDAHVHLNLPGDGSTLEEVVRETDGTLVATAAFASARALAAGITTVRDVGAARRTVFDVRRAQAMGHGHGARILACGQPLTITGGHTWYLGGEADGEDALRRKVREMAKLGADFIKVMASGGGTLGTQSWLPAYRPEELAAITHEAHRMERKVAMHCLCAASIDDAIAAGADHIEHAGFIRDATGRQEYVPATGERLARSGIPVSGTLAVSGTAVAAMERLETRTPAEQAFLDRWRRTLEVNLDQFRRMAEAGVRFVAGTDAGWRFTAIESLPMEVRLMQEGGMSTLAALAAVTGECARALGIDSEVGTLRPGMVADVIAVAGNPVEDLARLADVRMVMQGGSVRRPLA